MSAIGQPDCHDLSGALMLVFPGQRAAHNAILDAIKHVLANGPRTPDLGGNAGTADIGVAIAATVAA